MKGYFAIVQRDDNAEIYRVEFPDLPGCDCEAPTVEDALHAAERELRSFFDDLDEDNASAPSPRPAEELHDVADEKGGVAAACLSLPNPST